MHDFENMSKMECAKSNHDHSATAGPDGTWRALRRSSEIFRPFNAWKAKQNHRKKTEETWWKTCDRHCYFWVYPSVIKWKFWCEYNPWVMFHVWPEGTSTSNKNLNFMDDSSRKLNRRGFVWTGQKLSNSNGWSWVVPVCPNKIPSKKPKLQA